jgi:hypothetical protein
MAILDSVKKRLKNSSMVSAAKAVGNVAGTAYGKARYGMKYENASDKVIDTVTRNKMKEENWGAAGDQEASRELSKRRKLVKEQINKKINR